MDQFTPTHVGGDGTLYRFETTCMAFPPRVGRVTFYRTATGALVDFDDAQRAARNIKEITPVA